MSYRDTKSFQVFALIFLIIVATASIAILIYVIPQNDIADGDTIKGILAILVFLGASIYGIVLYLKKLSQSPKDLKKTKLIMIETEQQKAIKQKVNVLNKRRDKLIEDLEFLKFINNSPDNEGD
jgi:hypothetical protein